MLSRRRLLHTLVLLTTFSLDAGASRARAERPSPTLTEGARDRARKENTAGAAHMKAGRYDKAIEHFENAYESSNEVEVLYNLAQAHRLKGNCQTARALYREYLLLNPNAGRSAFAENYLLALGDCGPAALGPASYDEPPHDAPEPGDPISTLTASAEAHAVDGGGSLDSPRAQALGPERTVALVPQLAAGAEVASLAAPAPGRSPHLGLTFAGSSVALTAVAAYFGWQAGNASDRVSQAYATRAPWDAAAREAEHDGERDEKLAVAALSLAVAAAAGAVWFLLRR